MIQNRFDRAIAALVYSYMNDTLQRMNCAACAVGNMVAFGMNTRTIKSQNETGRTILVCENSDVDSSDWSFAIAEYRCGFVGDYADVLRAKSLIASTGYSLDEFNLIEKCFMDSTLVAKMNRVEDYNYVGLMAVVDLLCELEGKTDATDYKQMFTKPVLEEAGI